MRTAAAFVKAFASGLFCLGVAISTAILAGCGTSPSGSIGGGTTTTVTSVTVTPATGTVTAGNSMSLTATVQGQDNPSQVVTWSMAPANAGALSVGTAGELFTASSAITTPTIVTITAASTVSGYTNFTGTSIITINPVPPPTPTVTIAASPSTIIVGGSTTLTWSSTNTTGSCMASGAWSGTEPLSGSTTETPTATGTYTYTIGCTGPGGSATAFVTVTVNPVPLPNVTSVSQPTIFVDWGNVDIYPVTLNGTGFAGTYTVYPTGFNNLFKASFVNSSTIDLELSFNTSGDSPGSLTYAVCENSNYTNCGTSQSIAFLGAQNYLAASSSGELFSLDQGQGAPSGQNGYVRKYKADRTADGSFFVGTHSSIAVDNKTGNVLVDANDYDENGGSTDVATPINLPSSLPVTAVAAENGSSCFLQPAANSASCYSLADPTGTIFFAPVVTAANLGLMPWAIAMGTFGGETDAVVVSINDTPAPLLHKVRASDAYEGEEPALALTGITPMSTVIAANIVAGGLQVVAFDSGPDSGTVAVLSTYDQLIVLVNGNTNPWTIAKSVKLSGVPFRIFPDKPNGRILVAYADPTNARTTYSWVDAASGVVTPVTTTSSLLSVGLGYNGTQIISTQRNQADLEPTP